MIDRNALADEFNLEAQQIISELTSVTGDNQTGSFNNPNIYIEENIKKANKLLDKVLSESENGNFNARLAEVGSLLINSINIAYEKINTKKLGERSLQIKESMLQLRSRELDLKEKALARPITNNNLIIGDRETVLKLLKGEQQKMLDENVIEIREEEKDG